MSPQNGEVILTYSIARERKKIQKKVTMIQKTLLSAGICSCIQRKSAHGFHARPFQCPISSIRTHDKGAQVLCRIRNAREVRRDLLGRSRLFLADCPRRLNRLRDRLDRLVHLRERRLNLLRRLARLLREFADFLCNNGEASALLARVPLR